MRAVDPVEIWSKKTDANAKIVSTEGTPKIVMEPCIHHEDLVRKIEAFIKKIQ
jgi:hypothetical protein